MKFKTFTLILFICISAIILQIPSGLFAQNSVYGVKSFKTGTLTITILDSATSASVALPAGISGRITKLSVLTPAMTSTATTTLKLCTAATGSSWFAQTEAIAQSTFAQQVGVVDKPEFLPLPSNKSQWYFNALASAQQSGSHVIKVMYEIWINAPPSEAYTSTITVANGATFGTYEIPTSIFGEILCAVVSTPAMTSNVNTTIQIRDNTTDNAYYHYTTGNIAYSTVAEALAIGEYGTFFGIADRNQTTNKTYWAAKAAGAQSGAKTITLYWIVQPYPNR